METCKQNGVNPRHYLIDVLELRRPLKVATHST
ncbi:transposase domain-containing protein [Ectothiorhodospira haloalkaliphila]